MHGLTEDDRMIEKRQVNGEEKINMCVCAVMNVGQVVCSRD